MERYPFEKDAGDKSFILCNGDRISSIRQLYEMIDSIDTSEFDHHLNDVRNDFSVWIKDVFGEEGLSDSLSNVNGRQEFKSVLQDWMQDSIVGAYMGKKRVLSDNADSNITKCTKKKEVSPRSSKVKCDSDGFSYSSEKDEISDIGVHLRNNIVDFVLGFFLGMIAIYLLMAI